MNCVDCQTDPLTPEHYCPCCGRKLSLEERRAKEGTSPAARCQSCGGVSADGDLCKSCQQAFAPVLGSTTVTERSDEAATAGAQMAPAVDTTTEAAKPPTVANVEPVKIEAFKLETAKAVADQTAKAHLAKAANPAPVIRRPSVPAPPPRRSRTPALLTAAAVLVLGIGVVEGARRLGFDWSQLGLHDGQPVPETTVAESVAAAEPKATPPDARSAGTVAAESRASGTAAEQAAARPKPTTAGQRRPAARQTNSSDRNVATVVSPTPAPETPAPVPTKPSAPAVAESQGVPAPPTGKFFERNDVDEVPQIATRVEPQLPANLPARSSNDVVVVRMLVSQSGHPFRVSLLRGSRLGRSADEAVVAAVTQWRFSPAKKRGEPVNCWFNIGVPLGQAN